MRNSFKVYLAASRSINIMGWVRGRETKASPGRTQATGCVVEAKMATQTCPHPNSGWRRDDQIKQQVPLGPESLPLS